MNRGYTIGQLATAAGVNVETVRYYQRRNLIAEPKRPPGRARRYGGADAERLRFIKGAQRLGFSLSEVKELLNLLAPMSCSKTRGIAATKLKFIDQRLQELNELRKQFVRLLSACDDNTDESRCPIIERLTRRARRSSTKRSKVSTSSGRTDLAPRLHPTREFGGNGLSRTTTMAPDSLEAAQSLYAAAYEAYQQASKRVAQKLASGQIPSAEEIKDEAKAVEHLAAVRRNLIDRMARLRPPDSRRRL